MVLPSASRTTEVCTRGGSSGRVIVAASRLNIATKNRTNPAPAKSTRFNHCRGVAFRNHATTRCTEEDVSDFSVFMLAAAVCAGARLAVPVPRAAVLAGVVVAAVLRRPSLVVLAGTLLASALAAQAWAGLAAPGPTTFEGVAAVVGDPAHVRGALRVDLRIGGRRVEGWAHGQAAGALRP